MKKFILLFCLAQAAYADVVKYTVVNHQFEGTKQWIPGNIHAKQGDTVEIMLINNAPSGVHNFSIPKYKINQNVLKGKKATIKFTATEKGMFDIKCGLHKAHVGGKLIIH